MAVGAGHQHLLHALLNQPVVHFREHFTHVLFAPQDVRRLQAAVKDDTDVRVTLVQLGKDLVDPVWSGAGEGTAGEEDCRAPLRQLVQAETARCAKPFISNKRRMLLEIAETAIYRLAPHLQKQSVQIKLLRAGETAEATETALERARQ